MFIEQPPWLLRALYPQAIFRMDPNERAVYLTFDDGPIPEVTPWVLDVLEKHSIKATFFMVGDNIRKHPDEYRMATTPSTTSADSNIPTRITWQTPGKWTKLSIQTFSVRHTGIWDSGSIIRCAIITASSCGIS